MKTAGIPTSTTVDILVAPFVNPSVFYIDYLRAVKCEVTLKITTGCK